MCYARMHIRTHENMSFSFFEVTAFWRKEVRWVASHAHDPVSVRKHLVLTSLKFAAIRVFIWRGLDFTYLTLKIKIWADSVSLGVVLGWFLAWRRGVGHTLR